MAANAPWFTQCRKGKTPNAVFDAGFFKRVGCLSEGDHRNKYNNNDAATETLFLHSTKCL